VTWLRDDVATLAERLGAAADRRDWLDAFLFAAGMLQVAEDALDAEPALLLHAADRFDGGHRGAAAAARAAARCAGAVAARGRPVSLRAWTAAGGEVVTRLADRVYDASLPADAPPLDALEPLPDALRGLVARQPACFRAFDQHPDDVRELVARFANEAPGRDRPLLVAGVRTSGSYLAPLAAAALRAAGYADVRVMTVRPGRRLRADQQRALRSVAARGGLCLVCDDPPASGRAVGAVARDLSRRGIEAILLLAVFGDALPERLRAFRSVVLPEADWAVTARLEPAAVGATVARLVDGVVSCVPLPHSTHPRRHVSRAYRVGLRLRGTGEPLTTTIAVEGVGLGHFGAHALAVHDALEPFLPAVLGLRDGLLYREWLAPERRADLLGDVPRLAERVAGYVDARARALTLREDHTRGARAARPAWEVAGLMLAAAFGPAESAGRLLVTDPAVRRLLRVRRPVETDGRMELSHWFARDDGELVKTDWAHAGERVASCDPACDLAQIAARDGVLAERVRAAWAALGREPVDAERWLLYRLAHLWSERDAALRARVARDYFRDVFFADLRPSPDGPLCALDVDGVLELDVLGFPALTPASAVALRALIVHGQRPVLVSGRGIAEIAERCAAFRLSAGVAEYGAVLYVAADGRETSLLTDDEVATLAGVRDELRGREGVEIDTAYRHVVRARPPSTTAVAPGVRVIVGDGQADFVSARVDKGVGIRALAARLDAPLHAAVGDTAADAPMLELAGRAFVPAHAPRELRRVAKTTRRPYQAGFHEAVGELLGHRPGSCAECRVPDDDERRRLLLALLGLREGGLRGMPRRALRVALAR
jgi:hypothetical protein